MGCCSDKDSFKHPRPLVSPTRIVVVTGGSSGLGFQLIKELVYHENRFIVILTARDLANGLDALQSLDPYRRYSDRVLFLQLDVTSEDSIERFAGDVKSQFGYVDVLVNNAGVNYEGWNFGPKKQFPVEIAEKSMAVNFFGAVKVTQALLPLFREHGHVINIGSRFSKFQEIPGDQLRFTLINLELSTTEVIQLAHRYLASVKDGSFQKEGWPTHNYITSKALLHAYTMALARETTGRIRVNAMCPGWTRTKLGGDLGKQSVEQGVRTYLKLVKSTDNATGQFYEDEAVSSFN